MNSDIVKHGYLLKVIACEIAFREISLLAAQSPHTLDLEFVTQGLHDHPNQGREEVQRRVNAVPPGKYDAVLLGYGLCGNIIRGLTTPHTAVLIPRAHDCITLFLGSKERYQQLSQERPGSYYYTSGWLECARRRGRTASGMDRQFLPAPAGSGTGPDPIDAEWVEKYGEEQAQYLKEVMGQWASSYTHGVLIDFEFTQRLGLPEQVQGICAERCWQFSQLHGDLGLLERWLNGPWSEDEFVTLRPGEKIVPSYDERVIRSQPLEVGEF